MVDAVDEAQIVPVEGAQLAVRLGDGSNFTTGDRQQRRMVPTARGAGEDDRTSVGLPVVVLSAGRLDILVAELGDCAAGRLVHPEARLRVADLGSTGEHNTCAVWRPHRLEHRRNLLRGLLVARSFRVADPEVGAVRETSGTRARIRDRLAVGRDVESHHVEGAVGELLGLAGRDIDLEQVDLAPEHVAHSIRLVGQAPGHLGLAPGGRIRRGPRRAGRGPP